MNLQSGSAAACASRGKDKSGAGASVMELRYRESAWAEVGVFIALYERGFLELYRDTGIWGDEMIAENVRTNARQLFTDIFDAIEEKLTRRRILGRKEVRQGWHRISFHVGSRIVSVFYSDDTERRIRWVEAIAVERKPIIF